MSWSGVGGRFVDGQVQGLAEDWGPIRQEGGQRAAVHVGAQEQAELLESVGGQQSARRG